MLSAENGQFSTRVLETGMGPSNVHVVHSESCDYLLTANREVGECAVFTITDVRQ
jgi:hypothetical protein